MTGWKWSVLTLTVVGAAAAQQQEPTFRARTEQVAVYVSVTDKGGKPLRHLDRKDFLVLEDGVAQNIDIFQEINWGGGNVKSAPKRKQVADAAQGSPPSSAEAGTGGQAWRETRFFIIRFDPTIGLTASKGSYGVSFDKEAGPASGFSFRHEQVRQMKRAMDAAREVVAQLDLSSDYAAVSWRNVLTEFTQDKQRLEQILTALDSSQVERQDAAAELAAVVEAVPGGVGSFEPSDIFDPAPQQDSFLEIENQIMLSSHLDGADLISRLKYLRGRKVVIYLGEGMPEIHRDYKDWSKFDPQREARIYSDAGFTVYAVSPRGLVFTSASNPLPRQRSTSGMKPKDRSESVFRLNSGTSSQNLYLKHWSEHTGGIAYYNRNDLKKGVREAFEQASHSYLLAYRSSRTQPDGKFHRIQVKLVEDAHKGAQLRHRNGYFSTAAGSADYHYRTIATALMAPQQFQDFPLTVQAQRSSDGNAVEFHLAFPFRDIRLLERQVPGEKKGKAQTRYFQEIRLMVAAFSQTGEYLGSYEKDFSLDLDDAQLQQMRSGSATVDRTMTAESGKLPHTLKSVVVVGQNEQVAVNITELGSD